MFYVFCLIVVILVSVGFIVNVWMILLGGIFEGILLIIMFVFC